MTDEIKQLKARQTFDTLCAYLDATNWNYDKDAEGLNISCSVDGDDLPIDMNISIDAKRSLILFLSKMPFAVSEEKRLDVAVAVSIVNNRLVDGCFDYNVTSGNMLFRMSNSFIDSEIGKELFEYIIYLSCVTVDDFNDKFLMLAKGLISIEKFVEAINDKA